MIERLYDLLNEETRTDTVIVRGIRTLAHILVIAAAVKFLL